MLTLALSALLAAAPDAPLAQEPPPAWLAPAERRVSRTERSFLVPALESALVNLLLATYNNLGSQQPWAQITSATIASHLKLSSWSFDTDYFVVNQFGHPYQGSYSFIAARSAGLSFWWSILYPYLSSLAWELLFEVDAPAVNDQISTPLGGAFLGEVFYRMAGIFLDPSNDLPGWLREVLAFVVAPYASANRFLFDDRFRREGMVESPWFRSSIGVGSFVEYPGAHLGAFLTLHLVYGSPVDAPEAPFDHFDMRASLSLRPEQVTGDLELRGLLWGRHFRLGALDGSAGLFGAYEYVAPRVLRASSVNLGAGVLAQYAFSRKVALEGTLVASGIVFGAGGYVGPNAIAQNDGRDYHIGPGFHGVGELTLVSEDLGTLAVSVRRWNFVGGIYAPPAGHDAITSLTTSVTLRLSTHLTGTLELVRSLRDARFEPVTITQSVTQLNLFFSWNFSDSLGTRRAAALPY